MARNAPSEPLWCLDFDTEWRPWIDLTESGNVPEVSGVYVVARCNDSDLQLQYIGASWGSLGLRHRIFEEHFRRMVRFAPEATLRLKVTYLRMGNASEAVVTRLETYLQNAFGVIPGNRLSQGLPVFHDHGRVRQVVVDAYKYLPNMSQVNWPSPVASGAPKIYMNIASALRDHILMG